MHNALETLENCRFCLMCRHVAPVGLVTHEEVLTPHGVGLIVTSQKRDLVAWNSETVGILFSEVDGGNSRAHCVNHLPFEEAAAEIRAELVADGMVDTAVLETIAQIKTYETPYAEVPPETAVETGDVALFVGDAALHLWPGTLQAVRALLKTIGVEPALIGRGRNNSFIPHSIGAPDLAREIAAKNVAELAATGAKTLLVLSAGDYYVWQQMMSERLGIARPSDVEVVEVLPFLVRHGARFESAELEAPAYIDPIHAVRVPERHAAVREMVTAVVHPPLRELFFRQDRAHPVGGTHLQFSQPHLAEKLTRARLLDAQTSGAATLLCEDPETLYHLDHYSAEYGLLVHGLYEFLSEKMIEKTDR